MRELFLISFECTDFVIKVLRRAKGVDNEQINMKEIDEWRWWVGITSEIYRLVAAAFQKEK